MNAGAVIDDNRPTGADTFGVDLEDSRKISWIFDPVLTLLAPLRFFRVLIGLWNLFVILLMFVFFG